MFVTYKFLVSDIDGQVSEGGSGSTHHGICFNSEQLHDDRKASLLTDGGSDILRRLK